MATIKHRASSARKLEAAGYFLRSVAIAAPLVGIAKNLAPDVQAGITAVKRRRNAKRLNAWINQPSYTKPKTVKIIKREDFK